MGLADALATSACRPAIRTPSSRRARPVSVTCAGPSPVSSRSSRQAACSGVSPASMPPCGSCHSPGRSARSKASTWPSERRTTATTPARKCGFGIESSVPSEALSGRGRAAGRERRRSRRRGPAPRGTSAWRRRVAGPVEQVGEHVPLAQVVLADLLGRLRGRSTCRVIASLQLASVGERTGDDDPALGHHLVGRRRLAISRQTARRRPAPERPVAVGQHREQRRRRRASRRACSSDAAACRQRPCGSSASPLSSCPAASAGSSRITGATIRRASSKRSRSSAADAEASRSIRRAARSASAAALWISASDLGIELGDRAAACAVPTVDAARRGGSASARTRSLVDPLSRSARASIR